MEIFIIILIILIGIGVLSILFINKNNLNKYLIELEALAVVFLLLLIIHIQSVIFDMEYPIIWSYEKSENNTYLYVVSIPNMSKLSINNVTAKGNKLLIYLDYCEGDQDLDLFIYIPEVYKNYLKELIMNKEVC